jgi:cell pole-organizing protein PopZ
MPDSDLSTEQSMDEILKKIERKLVDEGKPEEPAGAAPQSAEVLKLSDAAGDNRKGRAQNRGRPPGQETNRAAGEPVQAEPQSDEMAARAVAPASAPRSPSALDEPATGPAETLEDVVRELVKPMLRSWLDARLGGILNRLVQAELAKALEEVQVPQTEAASR